MPYVSNESQFIIFVCLCYVSVTKIRSFDKTLALFKNKISHKTDMSMGLDMNIPTDVAVWFYVVFLKFTRVNVLKRKT